MLIPKKHEKGVKMKTWLLTILTALLVISLVIFVSPAAEAKKPATSDGLPTFSLQASEEELKKDILAELRQAKGLATDKLINEEIGKVIKKVERLIKLQGQGADGEALALKYDILSELKGIIIAIPQPPPPPTTLAAAPTVSTESQLIDLLSKILEKVERLIEIESPPPPSVPPPPPTPAYTYSVKFIWGQAVSEKEGVKPANYATTVNVHNPSTQAVTLYKKAVVAHREWEKWSKISDFEKVELQPDDALEIDGVDICRLLGIAFPPVAFVTGFVVIQSPVPLDVVAVYTGSSKVGMSLDVEYIQPSAVKIEVTPPGEVHTPSGIEISPSQATNPVGTTHTVGVFVHCKDQTPIAGVLVKFSVSGANTASGSAVTDSSGKASFSYYGANTGTDTIIATETVTGLAAKATKTWVKKEEVRKPAKITLYPESAENRVGTSHTVTALVVYDDGTPVVGARVYFRLTSDSTHYGVSGETFTDSAGKATFTYPGTKEGKDQIVATVDSLGASAFKYWYGASQQTGKPAAIKLIPEKAENPVSTRHTVTAVVTDANGRGVAGVPVTFIVEGANPNRAVTVTDVNGYATFTWHGEKEGTDKITAMVDNLTARATKVWYSTATGRPQ